MAKVQLKTSMGDIIVLRPRPQAQAERLYDETPLHRDNFIKLAGEDYYDGTLFHRVMMHVA